MVFGNPSGAIGCHRIVFGDSVFDTSEKSFLWRMEFRRDPVRLIDAYNKYIQHRRQ